MKPNRKYTQTIVKSFHISGVALDEGDSAKVYITADKTKFIVATLSKSIPQMTLDLNFCKGDKIMFQTTGETLFNIYLYTLYTYTYLYCNISQEMLWFH